MKNIHTPSHEDLDVLLQNISRDIFNEQIADLIEVTYAYADLGDGKLVNKTLFGTFLGHEYTPKESDTKESEKLFWEGISQNISEISLQVKDKILQKQSLIRAYQKKLHFFVNQRNHTAEILLASLEYADHILELTLTGLPFELQKAGIPHQLSAIEVEQRVDKMEHIETELFGGNVRENVYEVQGSYTFLSDIFSLKKHNLTEKEQNQFSEYLNRLTVDFPFLSQGIPKLTVPENPQPEILTKEISRENYVEIFKLVFDLYGIQKPIVVEERSSIYDGEYYLGIPNTAAYKTLKLKRVLALIQHEIETHYLIASNNSDLLGQFRGAGNLQREEGLAMQSERFLEGKTFEDLKITGSIPDILMGEILTGHEYENFMLLLSKLKGDKNYKGSYIRRKRNYPLDYRGVQHKDTSYNRGEHKVVQFLQNGGDVKDLYLAKVSFEDIAKVKEIFEQGNYNLKYPLLVGELLQYVLTGNQLRENDFWNYLEKKYPFINIREEITNKTVEKFTFAMKRKILTILQLLQ